MFTSLYFLLHFSHLHLHSCQLIHRSGLFSHIPADNPSPIVPKLSLKTINFHLRIPIQTMIINAKIN